MAHPKDTAQPENAAPTGRAETPRDRADPADASASDRLRLLPENPQTTEPRPRSRQLIIGLVIVALCLVGIALLLG
ncbi:hypothetical protein [Poseidonocella sedimentorum]|uniref:Uncharacterized protein n=1 Tax=Poseidonocella sedimentorum TaxID=871652 RepID=A0A1I6CVD3_9RHOB|nr:hypothetical protein [Poseidonocella sedimentorum]SFQ97063.1 hypothetical protein SAMN04515673_101425 [Poseidonocella sedimentorum]